MRNSFQGVSALALPLLCLTHRTLAQSSGSAIGSTSESLTATATSAAAATASNGNRGQPIGPYAYTAPPAFPTKYYQAFFPGFGPSQTSVEVQPMITSPVNGKVYPLNLTLPADVPQHNLVDPVYLPPTSDKPDGIVVLPAQASELSTSKSRAYANEKITQIVLIINGTANGTSSASNCTKCTDSLAVAKDVAHIYPWEVPYMLIQLCQMYNYDAYGSCEQNFEVNSDGGPITSVIYYADVTGLDGRYICSEFIGSKICPFPNATELSLDGYFAKPKPKDVSVPKPSGKRMKVAHLSDFHLDPRYLVGSESNCSQYLCCQSFSNNTAALPGISVPAPRYGAYQCDSPWDLAGAVMQAVPVLAGLNDSVSGFNFTLYTGDLVSHLNDNQLSRAYVEYCEDSVFGLLRHYLGTGPVYAALGNHDSWPQALNSQRSLAKNVAAEFNWNYEHVSKLWETLGWISDKVASVSQAHYGGYSTVTPAGLKIITINTDFWYRDNYFNYINMTNPDLSGTLRFLADELQAAEDAGQRAYVIGHVLSGWSGSNGLPNPTNLFYQIIDRYSPHVVANIFFGHTHEDQLSIFYANNATNISAENALAVSWIGPSVTPLTDLNSGFRVYEVDAETFDVLDAYTYFSNVSNFAELDGQNRGPAYHFEYSTREAYGGGFDWPADAPLNATWWHKVTESMESNNALVSQFNTYQGKQSARTTNCTSAACVAAKICYLRSGSTPIATENCSGKYASVQ